jgi:hypothetical protein
MLVKFRYGLIVGKEARPVKGKGALDSEKGRAKGIDGDFPAW